LSCGGSAQILFEVKGARRLHLFDTLEGMRRAFEEFFHGRPERVVELWDTQRVVWAPEA
jgi:hypothetical protein